MNRSNYHDDYWDDQWGSIMWRGAVASATRGKRGQKFLKDLVAALEAMPEKKLIHGKLEVDGQFCALGCVAHARQLDIATLEFPDNEYDIDCYHSERIAQALDIADALAREVMFVNDESHLCTQEINADEQRWRDVHNWATRQITKEPGA